MSGPDTTIRTGGDEDALFLNNLHAFWIDAPRNEIGVDGIGAIEHMIRVGAMFVIPADRFDTSTYSKTGDELSAYCYENYPGGIGVAKKLFDVWHFGPGERGGDRSQLRLLQRLPELH